MSVKMNKKSKGAITRKNAEAQKAAKKAKRATNSSAAVATAISSNKKGRSLVAQSKTKKR